MYKLFSIFELHHYSSTDRLFIFPDGVGIHDLLTRAKTRWVGDQKIRPFHWPAHYYTHYELYTLRILYNVYSGNFALLICHYLECICCTHIKTSTLPPPSALSSSFSSLYIAILCPTNAVLPLSLTTMLSFHSSLACSCLFAVFQHLTWAVSLQSTGQTLVLNDIPYYVPPTPFTTIPSLKSLHSLASAGGLAPVTVIQLAASNASLGGLEQAIDGFKVDDVWNEGFVEGTWMFWVLFFRQDLKFSKS